jgi:glycosyltransferase involved in cell wall biosynthesis
MTAAPAGLAPSLHPQTGSRLQSLDREVASFPRHRRARAAISPRLQWRRLEMARRERLQAAHARRIIAVSRRIRAMLARRHGVAEEGIVLIPNGVDTRRFTPDNAPWLRAPTRRRLGVGARGAVSRHGTDFRLKGGRRHDAGALARLVRSGRDVRLAIAGGTPDPFWHGLVQRLGLGDRVDFRGRSGRHGSLLTPPATPSYIRRGGMPASLATIEAMAERPAVVTSAWTGAGGLIADGPQRLRPPRSRRCRCPGSLHDGCTRSRRAPPRRRRRPHRCWATTSSTIAGPSRAVLAAAAPAMTSIVEAVFARNLAISGSR